MKVLSLVKTLSPRTIFASMLLMISFWWIINSFVNLAISGQGWPALVVSVVVLVCSAKLLPHDNIVRSILREFWAKA